MKNLTRTILISFFLSALTLTACSSCSGAQEIDVEIQEVELTDITEEDVDTTEDIQSVDAEDGTENVQTSPVSTCPPSESPYCILDYENSVVSDLYICMMGTEVPTEITALLGPEFEGSGVRMFTCLSYLPHGSEEAVDLFLVSYNDVFISVSETYMFENTDQLVQASQLMTLMYEQSCERTRQEMFNDSFSCILDSNREIVVSITAVSDLNGNTLVINLISDADRFYKIISDLESVE